MGIAFIILYILANELTYMVALHQQMGLVRHISAGDLCWINRIIMLVPCIWYCGWFVGICLFLFSLFGLLHATLGWIFTIPSLFSKSQNTIFAIAELECGLLIPANIICVIFTVLSFFVAKYKTVLSMFNSSKSIIVLSIILIIGLLVRIIVAHSTRNVRK